MHCTVLHRPFEPAALTGKVLVSGYVTHRGHIPRTGRIACLPFHDPSQSPMVGHENEHDDGHHKFKSQKYSCIVFSVIVEEHHLPNVSNRVADKPHRVSDRGRRQKLSRNTKQSTPSTPTVRSAIPTSNS